LAARFGKVTYRHFALAALVLARLVFPAGLYPLVGPVGHPGLLSYSAFIYVYSFPHS
jgi:hypothetical protein